MILVVGLLGAPAVAGCGEDGGPGRAVSVATGQAQGLPALAARCGMPVRESSHDAAVVPAGLLPVRSLVVAGEGARAVALVASDLATAYQAISDNAPAAGLTVTQREFEGIDAEVFLDGPDGPLTVALTQTPRCGDATRVVLRRGG